jgi:putative FmdB family regulatory protein
MPLYDYLCKDCGEAFEVRATIKEKEAGLDLACPKCGSHDARQILSAALVLHGGKEFSPPACDPNAGPGCCG